MDIHLFKGQRPATVIDGEIEVSPMLSEGEMVMSVYQGEGDTIIFTNIRIIAVKGHGMPGDKVYHMSLPYKNITYFYWIMDKTFTGDCELHITLNPDMFVNMELKDKMIVKLFNELVAAYIK